MGKALSETELAMRLLGKPLDALDKKERRVIASIASHAPSTRDTSDMDAETSTMGEKMADRVAAVGGSWGFITAFAVILFGWMLINSKLMAALGITFDPYPFIFLNLMLSTLAAIQAPVIMMSQNRQAAKDRQSARLDYEINLRAELEIMRLHHKLDGMEKMLAQMSAAGSSPSSPT
jgi:uncharacterized membrane protein